MLSAQLTLRCMERHSCKALQEDTPRQPTAIQWTVALSAAQFTVGCIHSMLVLMSQVRHSLTKVAYLLVSGVDAPDCLATACCCCCCSASGSTKRTLGLALPETDAELQAGDGMSATPCCCWILACCTSVSSSLVQQTHHVG